MNFRLAGGHRKGRKRNVSLCAIPRMLPEVIHLELLLFWLNSN